MKTDTAKPDDDTKDSFEAAIRSHYNTCTPNFSFICGGMRRIAVDPQDGRVKKLLLRHGVRHLSKIQALIYTLVEKLNPDLFVDVGVNYGECLFGLPLNSRTKIIGFEANPRLLPYIERSMIYNDDLNVRLTPYAASDVADQSLPFFINNAWSGKSSAVPDERTKETNTVRILVNTTTLDRELSNIGSECATAIIKVDVEGFEPKVLSGAKNFNSLISNLIYLIEFDTVFLRRGGHSPEDFFNSLAGEFTVYLAQGQQGKIITKLSDYHQLSLLAMKSRLIHCDLLLVRSSNPLFLKTFDQEFANRSISNMAHRIRGA